MFDSNAQIQVVARIAQCLQYFDYRLVTAESCTGGCVAAWLTSLAGSSKWYEGGFVTYSNAMKQRLLDVPLDLLNQYGSVSKAVACAMVEGALKHSQAQIGLAITGIAGPSHGATMKPIGLVWIAWGKCYSPGADVRVSSQVYYFSGGREQIRQQASEQALIGLLTIIN